MNDPPLAELRERIDALDRDLLELLAQRNELVSGVARAKRASGTPIRDPEHERRVLARRRATAQELGLSPTLIEGLYRLILWGSRELQGQEKVQVPARMQAHDIAIIGGRGGMGRWLERIFGQLGHRVVVADLETELTPEEAAANAEVVVVSVPIAATVEVVARVGPHVRPGGLLMDITSVKRAPMEAMLGATRAEVVGTHPLFGPSVHSPQGQRVVLVRGRGTRWYDWVAQAFQARGMTTVEAGAEEHDRIMAVVQVLTHFSTEVLGRTLSKLDVELERTLEFTSPVYLIELLMTARHFAQSSDLYASIQLSNPATESITASYQESVEELRHAILNGDRAFIARTFDEVRQHFGPFTERALEESDYLIDRLVERS